MLFLLKIWLGLRNAQQTVPDFPPCPKQILNNILAWRKNRVNEAAAHDWTNLHGYATFNLLSRRRETAKGARHDSS
jgi:hypothetical protein